MTSRLLWLTFLLATSAAAAPRANRYVVSLPEGAAAQVSGTDFRDFFARAVESGEALDLRPTFQDLGLRLDAFYEEQLLAPDPAATPVQRRRQRALFGQVAL